MQNFTQTGSTAQTLSISSVLNITNSTFNGAFTSTSTSILLSGCTFNNVTSFTKTGTAHDYSAGGNYFANNSTFTNSASTAARIRLANSSGDIFGGDATFNTSNGLIEVAYVDTTDFQGDVTINNSKVTFNNSSGFVMCTGGTSQEFGGSADYKIGKLIINKTVNGITLHKSATIDSVLTLTKGIIFTDTINIVTLKAGSTCSGASSLSFINGPMVRYGASSFTYPIGSDLKFRPITVSASSMSTDALKMQFINSAPQNSSTCDTTIRLGSCENWKVVYISNSKSRIFTISWDNLSCGVPRNSEIVISGWNGSIWKNLGQSSISGGYLQGTVSSTDSSASTFVCLGTLKNNLSIDSVVLGELLNYSLYTRDSILMNESVYSIGKVGSNYINYSVTATDSVLTNYNGSTAMASNDLINLLGTLNSLSRVQLDTAQLYNGTLNNGIYEVTTDLNINREVVLDSNKMYIIFVKGKLSLGDNSIFSSISNKPRNVIFVTDTLLVDSNAFINATLISHQKLVQIGEMLYSQLSMFSFNDLIISNDSNDFDKYATYYQPNFNTVLKGCTNLPQGCNNLVLNPGFDECVSPPATLAAINNGRCCNWISPTQGSPEYFHQNAVSWLGVPFNQIWAPVWPISTQADHGNYGALGSYVGVIPFQQFNPDVREYVQGSLTIPLSTNQNYYGEFYTNLWDQSAWSTNRMGMFISQIFPNPNNGLVLQNIPQIDHNPALSLNDEVGWMLINGCFTAAGGETRVTIGSFANDANTTVVAQPGQVFPFTGQPYYLIDDVSIVPIEVNAGTDVTVACTGSNVIGGTNCLEDLNPGQFTYNWILVSGNAAFGSLSNSSIQFPTFTASNTSPIIQTLVYQVQITTPGGIANPLGCTAEDQITVTILPCCTLNVALAAENACLPALTGSITGVLSNGTAPYNIIWLQISGGSANGNFNTSTIPFTISNLTPGSYSVLITDANNCTSSATTNIVSSSNPAPPIISGSTSSCVGTSIYSVNVIPGLTYTWSFLPSFSVAGASVQFNPLNAAGSSTNATFTVPNGQYSNFMLQVVATNADGCSSSNTFAVGQCCPPDPNRVEIINGNSSAFTNGYPQSINIQGTFIVSTLLVDWFAMDITMGPGAEIIVLSGCTLRIRSSVLKPCTNVFWKSISVYGMLLSYYSEYQGAQYAVDVYTGGGYTIEGLSEFYDNYVSLRVAGSNSNGQTRIIRNSDIGLHPGSSIYSNLQDYLGQTPSSRLSVSCNARPYAGIELNFAGANTVGSLIPNQRLYIRDATYGIYASTYSFLNVVQTSIENIYNDPCNIFSPSKGSGIYAFTRNPFGGNVKVSDGGAGTAFKVFIKNCRTGIKTEGVAPTVFNTNISDVFTGIHSTFLPSRSFQNLTTIHGNKISFKNHGIFINNTYSDFFASIQYNDLSDLANLVSAKISGGIIVIGQKILGSEVIIENNIPIQMDHSRFGVYVDGLSRVDLNNNKVFLNSLIKQQRGIVFKSSDDLKVADNDVFGVAPTSTPNRFRLGLLLESSGNVNLQFNEFHCNHFVNMSQSIFFDNTSSNLDLANNVMENNQDGMHLETAIVNNQIDKFNKWCGSQTNSSIYASPGSAASFLVTNATAVAPPSNCFYDPYQFSVLGLGSVTVNTNLNSINDPGCLSIPIMDTNDITDYDRYIADSLESSNLPVETQYQLRRLLSFKLIINPDLVENDSSMFRFWNSEQNSEPIKLANYDLEVRNIFNPIAQDSGLLASAIQNFWSSYSEISLIDSLISIDSTFSDELILQRRDDEARNLDSLQIILDSLLNINNVLLNEKASEISDRLNAEDLISDLAILERQFLMFQLKYGPWSNEIISEADSNLIIEIANRCLYTNGLPVSRARGFYSSWFDDIIVDDDLCNSNNRLLTPKENDILVNSFSLNPNPTKNQLTVKINLKDEENSFEGNLNIYSYDRKLIATFKLSSYNTNLDISAIVNGLYIVEINSDSMQFERKKLIVLK